MPKKQPTPHFDVSALTQQVQLQDIGLAVSTNNPKGFLRIMYDYMRAQPSRACHIYQAPQSPQRFYLTKKPAPTMKPASLEDDADAEAN